MTELAIQVVELAKELVEKTGIIVQEIQLMKGHADEVTNDLIAQ